MVSNFPNPYGGICDLRFQDIVNRTIQNPFEPTKFFGCYELNKESKKLEAQVLEKRNEIIQEKIDEIPNIICLIVSFLKIFTKFSCKSRKFVLPLPIQNHSLHL